MAIYIKVDEHNTRKVTFKTVRRGKNVTLETLEPVLYENRLQESLYVFYVTTRIERSPEYVCYLVRQI